MVKELPQRTQQGQQHGQQQGQQQQYGQQQKYGQQEPQNKVPPMQVLNWHEQRLNKIDELFKNLETSTDNNQVISQLIDTIGILDSKIVDLVKELEEVKNVVKNNIEIVVDE